MPKTRIIQRAALASALRRVPIFQGVPEEDVSCIAGYASRQSLAKNEILFEEGGKVKGFFIVTKGMIKAYRIGERGREQLIHLVHPDDSFAEPAVAGLPGYPAHTKALEKTEVILIPATDFLEHGRTQPELSLRMLASLSRHLQELATTIENYKLRDAETRLLHWLLHRCEDGELTSVIHLSISKGTLASELGTRQETLTRILAKLRDAGEIEVSGREITVLDTGRLHRLFANQETLRSTTRRIPTSEQKWPIVGNLRSRCGSPKGSLRSNCSKAAFFGRGNDKTGVLLARTS